MKTRRSQFVALTSLAAVGVVAASALTGPSRPAGADAPKTDPGQVKALYGEKCSACHNLPKPEEKGFTRSEWQRTVNTMLTKYHASDSISPTEASTIVDYLATFAPKNANKGGGRRGGDPWATDGLDVWTDAPTATRVYNFEAGGLPSGLAPVGSGTPGPAPVWQIAPDKPGVDGTVARVTAPGFRADRFALLVDRSDGGRNLDVRVRFRIDAGKASPAVGIVFGYADPNTYAVLRCNQAMGDLALIQIAGANHTTVQQNPLVLPPPGAAPPATPPKPTASAIAGAPAPPPAPVAAAPPPTPLAPGWHVLRLLVHDGQVRGWLDMQKRINTTLPAYTGGKVGLWTQGNTTASFDDWTVDWYDGTKTPPLS